MKLYCVRHGESQGNRDKIHQSPDTPLSDIGLDQAWFVAHRFTKIAIDHILTSPYDRAYQTAKVIRQKINKPLTVLPALHEIDKPTIVLGKPYEHPDSTPYYEQLNLHKHELRWHYADDENYFDLFHRAKKALAVIEARPETNLMIVSHGTFLTMFLTMMLFPMKLNLPLFERLHIFAHLKNTAISVYGRDYRGKWTLQNWNDYAHLG